MIASSPRFVAASLGLTCLLVLTFGLAGGRSVASQAPAAQRQDLNPPPANPPLRVPPPGVSTEDTWLNIKVMKGMPAELMQPSIQYMEISLGVHCVYCHDDDATHRELDTKATKETARQMITMTQNINKTMFEGENRVTCFTCHRGHTKPPQLLPYNDEETRERTRAPVEAVVALNTGIKPPTAEELINNSVIAIGGSNALAKASGRVEKGVVTNYSHIDEVHPERAVTSVTPYEVFVKGAKRMTVQHNINGDALNTFAGRDSWIKAANGDPRPMRADEREALRMEEAVLNPLDFKQFLTGLKVVGQEKVGDHTAWIVQGSGEVLRDVKLYFDPDSGLLLSIAWQQPSFFCCHQFRIDYDNYMIVNGVRVPAKWTLNAPRQQLTVFTMDTVKADNTLEDSKFMKPTPARVTQR